MAEPRGPREPLIVGRYALYDAIASGGMATVHLGRLLGAAGFSRVVAIKRLHRHYANNPEFVAMFVDEARLAARIRHPNVVPTLDVVRTADELFLVMEYVSGESLAKLLRVAKERGLPVAPGIATAIATGMLHGLHAAHTAHGERGEPLEIVHRDVSPQNVMVGTDGVARVLDFGIAKARVRVQTTREGQIKGKLGYVSPEQLRGNPLGSFTDVYAAAVVLWEMLAGRQLFEADEEAALLMQVLDGPTGPPSAHARGLPSALDDVVMRGLNADPAARFATAKEMAVAVERACQPASVHTVGEWVEWLGSELLRKRAGRIEAIESDAGLQPPTDLITPVHALPSAPGSWTQRRGEAATREDRPSHRQGEASPLDGADHFSPLPAGIDPRRGGAHGSTGSDLVPTLVSGSGPDADAWLVPPASPVPMAPSRSGWARVAVATAVVLLAAMGAGAWVVLRWDTQKEPSGDTSHRESLHRDAAAPATSGAPTRTVTEPEEPSASLDEPPPASAASAPDAAPPATPAGTRTRTLRRPPRGSPKPDCSIPYFVDADGIRHVRPECVE